MFSCLKTTSNSLINTLDGLLLACGAAPLRQTRGRVPLLLCTKGTATTAAGGERGPVLNESDWKPSNNTHVTYTADLHTRVHNAAQ